MVWWMDARKFSSTCRICGCWNVQNKHWMPRLAKVYNDTALNIKDWKDGQWEECRPSDNLEYLEWCLEHKNGL